MLLACVTIVIFGSGGYPFVVDLLSVHDIRLDMDPLLLPRFPTASLSNDALDGRV